MGKVIVLAGPNRAGMRHVRQHLFKFSTVKEIPVITSRHKGEKEIEGSDGYFRTRAEIEALRQDPKRYIVHQPGKNLNAIDLEQVINYVNQPRTDVIMIVPPSLGAVIAQHEAVKRNESVCTVLLSHVSLGEANRLLSLNGVSSLRAHIASILLIRTLALAAEKKQKATSEQLEKWVGRDLTSAMDALQYAKHFRYVVKCPWSGHESWNKKPLIDETAYAIASVYRILKGQVPEKAEYAQKWPAIEIG